MEKIKPNVICVLVAFLFLGASIAVYGQDVDLNAPVATTGKSSATTQGVLAKTLMRVPNVVGLIFTDAESELRKAGFEPKENFLDEPDARVTYGHVLATVPVAGTVQAGGEVEIQIPRTASKMGIGMLGLSDVERRAGFDLDEGRYEEILRGADIVLRKYDNAPVVDENGHTYYAGGGIYIEPSDGAVIASTDGMSANRYGLGSYLSYLNCTQALKKSRIARVEISHPNDGLGTICVLTSNQQMAIVLFRLSDNPYGSVTDYKFHHALFLRQFSAPTIEYSSTAKGTISYQALGSAKAPPSTPTPASSDVTDLAAKGESIANQDPLSTELRNRLPEGASRRGFDIGMAAAEGQTAPGPGKQRIHDSLGPDEQKGFESAVAFSLERNRNAELAAKGAAIAAADPIVAEARVLDGDVFYWLGFDIATGIFGDPALGALGNTATGPGSMKIRDALSVAGQRGFNASVKLHLSRNYKL